MAGVVCRQKDCTVVLKDERASSSGQSFVRFLLPPSCGVPFVVPACSLSLSLTMTMFALIFSFFGRSLSLGIRVPHH